LTICLREWAERKVHQSLLDERDVVMDALTVSEERSRSILSNAMDGIVTIDEAGKIQTFNSAAGKIFNYSADELIGMSIDILIPDPFKNILAQYLKKGPIREVSLEKGVTREFLGERKDGTLVPIEISISEMLLNNKLMFVGCIRDISQRRQAEEKIKGYARDLEKSNIELQKFTYTASHDLQEPLRKVVIFGDKLLESCSDRLNKNERDFITRMQRASFRMKDLIEDLLSYCRLSHEGPKIEPLNLNEIVREVIDDLEILIVENAADIKICNLKEIEGDKIQIRQLFQNIISNALKYKSPEVVPKIVVSSWYDPNNKCVISIKDNGIGVENKFHDKIFEPFQRLNTSREINGTGMGLYICKKIITSHKGTLTIESSPQNGSNFIINIPVNQSKKT
jgi:two-component system, LuxR family, sensor kinase FixL